MGTHNALNPIKKTSQECLLMQTFRGVKRSFQSEQDDWFQPKRKAQIKLIPIQGKEKKKPKNKTGLIWRKAWQQMNSNFFRSQDKLIRWQSERIGTEESRISKTHLYILQSQMKGYTQTIVDVAFLPGSILCFPALPIHCIYPPGVSLGR